MGVISFQSVEICCESAMSHLPIQDGEELHQGEVAAVANSGGGVGAYFSLPLPGGVSRLPRHVRLACTTFLPWTCLVLTLCRCAAGCLIYVL